MAIDDCRSDETLADAPSASPASVAFAMLHGLIVAEAGGRMHAGKGLTSGSFGLDFLITLLFRLWMDRRR